MQEFRGSGKREIGGGWGGWESCRGEAGRLTRSEKRVYQFPGAAITNNHKLGGFKHRSVYCRSSRG